MSAVISALREEVKSSIDSISSTLRSHIAIEGGCELLQALAALIKWITKEHLYAFLENGAHVVSHLDSITLCQQQQMILLIRIYFFLVQQRPIIVGLAMYEFLARRGGCGVLPRLSEALPTDDALNQNIYLPGATVTYNCRPGFVQIPGLKRLITCLENYTWSTPDPFCQRRSCGNPGEIENGEMEADDFLFGSRVTYTCNTGYRMQSRRNYRDCQADGVWSNASPQCDVVICEAPNVLSDITIEPQKDEYNYLDSVSFSCRKPLEIAGNASVHCTADGTWSSDFPTCKASKCDKMWELQEEARKCTSTPDEWIKYLQVQYLFLQIENLKLDIEIKKKKLSAESTT
ncbi:PREDICTED: complement decay-accelerating factor-like [Nanorana parkeri]|uniref:complement decay-accelerating factor-like n=1 Tax=Nanorana parkeri TaxID=125878 RepID=UPI000854EDC1|nr:PREDICTED: complement decay-accelerating factor-like [Nanorana parkeri]